MWAEVDVKRPCGKSNADLLVLSSCLAQTKGAALVLRPYDFDLFEKLSALIKAIEEKEEDP